MKTSYFSNIPFIDTDEFVTVSISAKSPDWYLGDEFKVLAPTYDILTAYKSKQINDKVYTEMFNRLLCKSNASKTLDSLFDLVSSDKEIVLLCYEKPYQFCHRHLVANWFNRELSLTIKEL